MFIVFTLIYTGTWSKEDFINLVKAVNTFGKKWKYIFELREWPDVTKKDQLRSKFRNLETKGLVTYNGEKFILQD